ncbi:SUMF1/EgtB/PvdO family nonheme iron enzyme [Vibrio hepatarius]|uniref:SUMF1/EgtB/PvdO family nonheme iron enzyme n=1 Tax=Vibrio hepatarius TaxID=171383 RepID=UPI00373674EE
MRLGLSALLLALSPCLLSPLAIAEEAPMSITAIDDQLFSKHDELRNAQKALKEQQSVVDEKSDQLNALERETRTLDKTFSKAKSYLEDTYDKLETDPSADIIRAQKSYQEAWSGVKQNQKARLAAEQSLTETQANYDSQQREVDAITKAIADLQNDKTHARVEQLREELKQPQQLSISFTNRCDSSLTLAQCDKQTQALALQKAVKQYRSELVNRVSEPRVVERNIHDASLNIHIVKHTTTSSGFYDGERYRTLMDVELEARPSAKTACDLLGVDTQHCFEPGIFDTEPQFEQEIAWVTLAIRSNVYGDSVTIDGVSYGSTPVEVMLPIGIHNVMVQKEGYKTFNKPVTVKTDSSLRANLIEKSNPLNAGDKFADGMKALGKGPQLVAILNGTYYIGENASNQVHLDHAFGFGVTPVTVSQFASFVEQTDYQTDAELKNTCTALIKGEVTPVENSHWRDPGFKQYPNSPVVCVSQNDAKAYTNWLRKQTGAPYRLPTEDEWEIAVRAGSITKYWWGNDFTPGEANTGWSGTPWSNTSTSPVSAFKPNQLGIYDGVGNVWQWTSNPQGIAKGGAWNFSPDMAAADKQLFLSRSSAANYLGFRVVRDIQ